MAGYSGKPLAEKLGLKPGMKAALVGAPKGYEAALAAPLKFAKPGSGMDFIQFFALDAKGFKAGLPRLKSRLAAAGMLWVCWPKKTSALRRDLDEGLVRGLGLKSGLVDVKVCAVDGDWSGLKFVVPLKLRAP
jgi:hypothetical protein